MPAVTRIAAALLCAFAATSAVQAQQRSVRPATNVVPSAASRAAQSAPKPTGLMPAFPAGITSGSGAAVATNPIAQSNSTIPNAGSTIANTTPIPTELPPANAQPSDVTTIPNGTNVLGAGGAYGGAGLVARGPAQSTGGAGGISATDAARAFFFADANHDGELTRAEFARLGFASLSFEEMDRNFDGVISRFEYDDSLR
jgi:hypothetical protein